MFVVIVDLYPMGIIGQWNTQWSDPLHILECVFLPDHSKKTAPSIFELIAQLIIKCQQRCLQSNAKGPAKIIVPVAQEYFE